MFFRRHTDGTQVRVPLENQYAGPFATPCWIVGGGPSLSQAVAEKILQSPAPRFAINLAGAGLLRPHFWTSYDPTSRFHRSIYLDPAVTKFVHQGRAMDVVPETTYKVCECPALYLIDREKQHGFQQFPGVGDSPLTDWQDSLIQAIDLAYRLGFRELFLVGTEMNIAPSPALKRAAAGRGVTFAPLELLGEFVRRCEQTGMSRPDIETLATGRQYHFDEAKSLAAAIQTDFHYFRVSQYLRLARRSLGLAGLKITSVTPRSRLNDDFPCMTVADACRRITNLIGDPSQEQTWGLYTEQLRRQPDRHSPVRDFRPHFWTTDKQSKKQAPAVKKDSTPAPKIAAYQKLNRALAAVPEIIVEMND